jgi:hypothetical protein
MKADKQAGDRIEKRWLAWGLLNPALENQPVNHGHFVQ